MRSKNNLGCNVVWIGVAYQSISLLDELVEALGAAEVKGLAMVPNDQGDTGILAAVSRGGTASLGWIKGLFEGDKEGMEALARTTNKDGTDLVQAAVGGRHEGTVRSLISLFPLLGYGAANDKGIYPMHLAAERDCGGIVKALKEAGAGVEVRDKNGATPLMVAAFVGAKDAARKLIDAGADKEKRDGEGRRAVDLAEIKNMQEIVDILK